MLKADTETRAGTVTETEPVLFVSKPRIEIGNRSIVRIQTAKAPRVSRKHDCNCLQFGGTCAIISHNTYSRICFEKQIWDVACVPRGNIEALEQAENFKKCSG